MKKKNRYIPKLALLTILSLGSIGALPSGPAPIISSWQSDKVVFAVIGDFGQAGQAEADVANLVKSWNPDFIVTLGDNNYPNGAGSTIDQNIGQYYQDYIFPYRGQYGPGAMYKRFFPSLGNHDWTTNSASAYFNYFSFYNRIGYYDFIKGPVHFFVLDSDPSEPDGTSANSQQAIWLKKGLAASSSNFNLVVFHHAPYSSGAHGSTSYMQWPFKAWGADAVLSGHDHIYERLLIDGLPYFVNGVGGAEIYPFGTTVVGSQIRYNQDFGAMRVEASSTSINFQFFSRSGILVDEYAINKTIPVATAITRLSPNPSNAASVDFLVTFSEPVSGVDAGDFSLNISSVSGASVAAVSGSGNIYDVTVYTGTGSGGIRLDLLDDDSIVSNAGVSLGGIGLGNGALTTGETYDFDNTPPFVDSIAKQDASPTDARDVEFLVTLSEAVTGVDAADFKVSSANISNAAIVNVTGSGVAYEISVNTGTGSGTLRLDMSDDDSVLDAVGNALGGAGVGNGTYVTGEFYTIQKSVPMVLSITRASRSPTNATSVDWLVTFSEPVSGVDASDFRLAGANSFGASINLVDGSATTYKVSANIGAPDGDLQLDLLDDDSILGESGTPLGDIGSDNGNYIAGDIYALDRSAPVASSIIRAGENPARADSVDFIVTFSQLVDGVDVSDFSLNTANISGALITSVADANPFYVISVNTGTGSGTIGLELNDDGSITDEAGNQIGGPGVDNGAYTSGETYSIEKSSPVVTSITRAGSDPSAAASVDFIVTFSEPVSGVDASDFKVAAENLVNASVLNVTDVDPFYVVAVASGIGSGTLRLDLIDDASIADSSGLDLGGPGPGNGNFTTGDSYKISRLPVNFPAPSLREPHQDLLTNNPSPTFFWDRVRKASAYEVTIALDSSFTEIVSSSIVTAQSFMSAVPLADDSYYWRVRAFSPTLQPGKFSATQEFTVDTTPPEPPALLNPANGVATTKTVFTWEKLSAAVKYQIMIDNNADFSSPEWNSLRNDPRYKVSNLHRGTYFWQVRAKDLAGNWGAWSSTFTLRFP